MSNRGIPPKSSSLPRDVLSKLQVDLKVDVEDARQKYDIEGLLSFQRLCANLSTIECPLKRTTQERTRQETVTRTFRNMVSHLPGLNLTYAHASSLISRHAKQGDDVRMIYITGPGHGAPAVLASLYIEGSISRFYPQAETPGAIHEGGELGYALAVSYGSVMDKPDLITVCVVGDGESETGPTATAWHAHKFIDPAESGAVLPILHLNGFKISERTIPGTMDDLELVALFTGYGYQVRFVEYGDLAQSKEEHTKKEIELNANMAVSMEWAYSEIRKIQKAARNGNPIEKPRWPLIIMRTPKGMTGPRSLKDTPLEGSFHSHQVPLAKAMSDDDQLKILSEWLGSYGIEELLVKGGAGDKPDEFIKESVLRILPGRIDRRLGMIKETYAGYTALEVPDFESFGDDDSKEISAMKALDFLARCGKRHEDVGSWGLMFPLQDKELSMGSREYGYINTRESIQWIANASTLAANKGGRVIEMLSEHSEQPSDIPSGLELILSAFIGIVTTMVEQFAKFQKMALDTKWRGDIPSLNYIETSTLWRQEHNGYSHQNPSFIGQLLTLPRNMFRIYLPPDANCALSVMAHCLRSKNYVNLIVGSKAESPSFLTTEEAKRHCIAGGSVWKRFSTDEGGNPDITLVGIGVETTTEVIAAATLLKKEGVRVRVVNIVDLTILGEPGGHPHALSHDAFDALFGKDTPVIINFHGYPLHVKSLLFARDQALSRRRFEVLGYIEEGTTTTPWSMLRLNKAGRYDIASRGVSMIASHDKDHPICPRYIFLAQERRSVVYFILPRNSLANQNNYPQWRLAMHLSMVRIQRKSRAM
ncbi:D-xylulose 5-phosphate/D-fructose 6-phosphate phosphoketolase, putative [Rhizoctonia solani AG-1 IA]|uniref:D-xylulose 5-phosphate/D-fructose 6-phosphate phosphoketolase, putative n=1 Tax=Thanatephorus cucumeris (strain AG1-IA) TaxID=983506 RepID=L8WLI3_THACA|nr:D-xylulose 5-phosphate/D-fructose 6-phosphate phosphoketolase, putative [Rhizoctonia solani AG-1 IA]